MKKKPAKRRAKSRKGMIVTSIALDQELYRRLAIAALDERAAIAEVVRVAVRQWLDRRGRVRRG